jgi:sugar O-acyltransferase (sialic acid O-acetyltransferase NeuD family)
MTTDLVIVGAGGFARETAAAVLAINLHRPLWNLLGFLDDDPARHGSQPGGITVLGGTEALAGLPDAAVVVCVGNPRDYSARQRITDRLALPAERYATIVHPTASVSPGCLLGPGTVVLAQTALTADVTVGSHVAVMPQVVLTHDNVVEDFATIGSGVRLGGSVVAERGSYLGAGALVRESVRIGAWSLIGMGSLVLADVPTAQVWVGTPARYLRDAPSHQTANPGSRAVGVAGFATEQRS